MNVLLYTAVLLISSVLAADQTPKCTKGKVEAQFKNGGKPTAETLLNLIQDCLNELNTENSVALILKKANNKDLFPKTCNLVMEADSVGHMKKLATNDMGYKLPSTLITEAKKKDKAKVYEYLKNLDDEAFDKSEAAKKAKEEAAKVVPVVKEPTTKEQKKIEKNKKHAEEKKVREEAVKAKKAEEAKRREAEDKIQKEKAAKAKLDREAKEAEEQRLAKEAAKKQAKAQKKAQKKEAKQQEADRQKQAQAEEEARKKAEETKKVQALLKKEIDENVKSYENNISAGSALIKRCLDAAYYQGVFNVIERTSENLKEAILNKACLASTAVLQHKDLNILKYLINNFIPGFKPSHELITFADRENKDGALEYFTELGKDAFKDPAQAQLALKVAEKNFVEVSTECTEKNIKSVVEHFKEDWKLGAEIMENCILKNYKGGIALLLDNTLAKHGDKKRLFHAACEKAIEMEKLPILNFLVNKYSRTDGGKDYPLKWQYIPQAKEADQLSFLKFYKELGSMAFDSPPDAERELAKALPEPKKKEQPAKAEPEKLTKKRRRQLRNQEYHRKVEAGEIPEKVRAPNRKVQKIRDEEAELEENLRKVEDKLAALKTTPPPAPTITLPDSDEDEVIDLEERHDTPPPAAPASNATNQANDGEKDSSGISTGTMLWIGGGTAALVGVGVVLFFVFKGGSAAAAA